MIEAKRMMPKEEVLSVVTPRPYEDPLSVERRASEALETSKPPRDISLDSVVITATNRVIEARKAAPGGDLHAGEMINLVDMLASTPGAVDSLLELQNGGASK